MDSINFVSDGDEGEWETHFRLKEGTDPDVLLSIPLWKDYGRWEWSDYDQIYRNYRNLIHKHPDSYTVAKFTKMRINYFRVPEASRLYALFSDEMKATAEGAYMKKYIDKMSSFDNIRLPDWKTGRPEHVISDTTKYALVVFSTSWCAPCHEMIPDLKSLHRDLGDKLEIVYVSGDKKETIPAWRKLMVDEQIPWRSVLARSGNGDAIADYFVSVYPTCLLVHPGGKFEKCDIRNANDRARLVEQVSQWKIK